MRVAVAIAVVLMLAAVLLVLRRPRAERAPGAQGGAQGSAALRDKVLTREFLAGVAPGEPDVPRCVLMDWHVGNGVATLVAFDDGTTSLYLSSGGGVIGAGAHEAVRLAADAFRAQAAALREHFAPAARFDLPPAGTSVFYLVTDSATLSSGPVENARLQSGDHPLAALMARAQEVLTQIRERSD